MRCLAALTITTAICLPLDAVATMPLGERGQFSEWFENLRDPDTMLGCCGISDCRHYPTRMAGDHYEALIEGRWRVVPLERVITGVGNPTGQPVVCWHPALGITCFVQGPAS